MEIKRSLQDSDRSIYSCLDKKMHLNMISKLQAAFTFLK